MDTTNWLVTPSAAALTLTGEADGLRLGSLILCTLDRAGVSGQVLGRCVIYRRRVAVFELPGLNYALARMLVEQCGWGYIYRISSAVRTPCCWRGDQRAAASSSLICQTLSLLHRAIERNFLGQGYPKF